MKNNTIKAGINGFGRIGRMLLKVCHQKAGINIVVINELADNKTIAHLLKYDSVHGRFNATITYDDNGIYINEQFITVTHEKDINKLDWKKYNVDIVAECSGHFLDKTSAEIHITNGAKKVVLSAPPKDNTIKTIVPGVNNNILTKEDIIVSNASCTTNSAAPLIMVLDNLWKVESAYITTVHSYTSDQRLHDSPHSDLRRARAAAISIIPTTTGAAKALTKIFPHLDGNLGGGGIRVPVPDGSLTDITAVISKHVSVEEINNAFKIAAATYLKNVLEYTEDPIVSIDIVGNPYSCIFDSLLTSVVGSMVKVVGWYDNEVGYSNRLHDLIVMMNGFE